MKINGKISNKKKKNDNQKRYYVSTLDPKAYYGGNIRIVNNEEEEYDSEDYNPVATENLPDKYIVELTKAADDKIENVIKSTTVNITTTTSIYDFQGNKIIIRPEEALIVILVLILWIGAIGLFFHRWGKIRMLEPYTPKFEAELHRPSCPLTSIEAVAVANKRMSLGPLNAIQCGSWNPNGNARQSLGRVYSPYSRPRLNSVFVGPHLFSPPQPPRKTKSAVDIHSLLLEAECEV
ncbi:CLUMA_CG010017, isoform A [Clunio marinus]|uniref:CLUMA_CG010017, isoform A n=1 Tax=Clunio marinus TaxID=568069 RepID=A0A1J1I8A5_9DIPT|nr:CLUMA_CG010017, isoform A [Clunio marinus]